MNETERRQRSVIAISGVSGAGKTTLVHKVASRLGDATTLFFDHYHHAQGSAEPDDLNAWLGNGGDPNAFTRPLMTQHLRRLLNGEAVTNPHDGTTTNPANFVVMDELFGRGRTELHNLINFVVCINVPLEVAFARSLSRIGEEVDSDARLGEVVRAMTQMYLHGGLRETYLRMIAVATADCELVVDGTRDPVELADEVVRAVRVHRGTGQPPSES